MAAWATNFAPLRFSKVFSSSTAAAPVSGSVGIQELGPFSFGKQAAGSTNGVTDSALAVPSMAYSSNQVLTRLIHSGTFSVLEPISSTGPVNLVRPSAYLASDTIARTVVISETLLC